MRPVNRAAVHDMVAHIHHQRATAIFFARANRYHRACAGVFLGHDNQPALHKRVRTDNNIVV